MNDFTPEYIRGLIDSYAACAARARRAGVDGVEIHGAHAHEVAQFLSPFYNRRQDEYGGSPERRARFAAEIVRGIKRETGADYPLIFRISGDELVEGGRRIQETAAIAGLRKSGRGCDSCLLRHAGIGYAISAPMDMEDLFTLTARRG
ncbi:MAG: hypothetical protein ACLVL7_00845 [Anaerotruncus massiliensis (ex Togo et al. 2019)]